MGYKTEMIFKQKDLRNTCLPCLLDLLESSMKHGFLWPYRLNSNYKASMKDKGRELDFLHPEYVNIHSLDPLLSFHFHGVLLVL